MLHLHGYVTPVFNLLKIKFGERIVSKCTHYYTMTPAGRPLKPAARDMAGIPWLDVYRQRKDTL